MMVKFTQDWSNSDIVVRLVGSDNHELEFRLSKIGEKNYRENKRKLSLGRLFSVG